MNFFVSAKGSGAVREKACNAESRRARNLPFGLPPCDAAAALSGLAGQ